MCDFKGRIAHTDPTTQLPFDDNSLLTPAHGGNMLDLIKSEAANKPDR